MLVWLMIVVSLGFAYMGLKKGLYVMFAVLFNLLFAVFISILSTRTLLSYSPQYEHHGYYASLGLFLLFCVIFGLLQMFAWFYFLCHREDYFPAMLDRVGGFLVGGVCGYIIITMLILMLCIMPCSVKGQVDRLCARDKMRGLCAPGVTKACDFLAWYSLECFDGESEKVINELLELTESRKEEEILYYVPDNSVPATPEEPSN
jgi:hypothetical protein